GGKGGGGSGKGGGGGVWGRASASKQERCLGLGVDHPLDYSRSGWEAGLGKFDMILDAIGGRSFRRSYSMLSPGGRLVAFGASAVVSGPRRHVLTALRPVLRLPRFNMIKQMSESKAVIGLNMLTLWKSRQSIEPWIAPLRELIDDGTVKPVVAGAFSFEDAGAAQTMITERRNVGKVVLVP